MRLTKLRLSNEVIAEVEEKHNYTIEYIRGYINTNKKCWWRCKLCGYEFEASPNNLMHGQKCKQCVYLSKLKDLIERVEKIHEGKIEYVSGYVNIRIKCLWRCRICGNEWYAPPNNVLNGKNGCPECWNKRNRNNPEEVIASIEKESNYTIKYISGFKLMDIPCLWKCLICGNEWYARPTDIRSHGTRCPICVKKSMEKPVREALKKKEIDFDYDTPLRDCICDINPLRPDFYIETEKGILWLECDGKQHQIAIYGDAKLDYIQKHDKFKNEYCKEHHICLIRVTSSTKWGTEKHITLQKILELLEIGIDSETKEVDFDLFWKYDFNRE